MCWLPWYGVVVESGMSEMPDMSEQRLEVWESGSGMQGTTEVCCCLAADDMLKVCAIFRPLVAQHVKRSVELSFNVARTRRPMRDMCKISA